MTSARAFYKVTKGKNSPFNFFLQEDGKIVSSSGVTRCDLNFKQNDVAGPVISSSVDPAFFTLQFPDSNDGIETDAIRVDLKDATLNPGRYEVEIFVWDTISTDGRFAGTINVQVDGPLSTPIGALPMDLFGNLRFPEATPSVITADQHDYVLATETHNRLASDAKRTITGADYVADGQVKKITNIGANEIVLAHQSISSAAENRFITNRGHDISIFTDETVQLIYDGTSNRWRVYPSPAPYFRITAAEVLASVVPVNTLYQAGELLRYGAAIDGATDDALAWQAALDQNMQGGPGVRWLGDSYVESELILYNQSKVQGYGQLQSRATWNGGSGSLFKKTTAAAISGVLMSDFDMTNVGTGSFGLDLQSISASKFTNLGSTGFVTAVVFGNSALNDGANNSLINVDASGTGSGFAESGVETHEGHLFVNCRGQGGSGGGFQLVTHRNRIIGGFALSTSSDGISVFSGDGNVVAFVSFGVSGGDDWNVGVNADDTCILMPHYAGASSITDAGTNTVVVDSDGLLRSTKSVVNVNTPSGATARAMPIYDNDGVVLGYIPVYGSQW